MKKNINILIGIGVGLTIIVVIWITSLGSIGRFVLEKEIKTSQKQTEEQVKEKVVLLIDNGQEMFEMLEIDFESGMTAFDLLKEGAEKLGLTLKTKSYDIGVFIEAIGNKENGQDGKYWLYYLNGEMPQVAADKQPLNLRDKVEFRFEASPF